MSLYIWLGGGKYKHTKQRFGRCMCGKTRIQQQLYYSNHSLVSRFIQFCLSSLVFKSEVERERERVYRQTHIKIVPNDRHVLDIQTRAHTEMLDDESRTIDKIGHIILISPNTCEDTFSTNRTTRIPISPSACYRFVSKAYSVNNKTTGIYFYVQKLLCVGYVGADGASVGFLSSVAFYF